MADPSAVSVVGPAYNEAEAIGGLDASLRSAAGWREIIVVDDGSSDGTGAAAAAARACVVQHPYNKGNGAAVKSGIRQTNRLLTTIQKTILEKHLLIDYVAAVDPITLRTAEVVNGPTVLAVAVRVGKTRLIDNVIVEP